MNDMLTAFRYLWASPWTLLGALVGLLGLVTGGSVRVANGVVQFYGGIVSTLLERLPAQPFAMTLGHVILGRTEAAIDVSLAHELIHVRQYERWGPIMVPSYLLCSLVLFLLRKDPYRDNPFEREAYGEES